jgi:pimeloyl-ACP methyl ester carboxylesterase
VSRERIHRATSSDGTLIVGRVHGRGPAVVLIHGGLGDGETNWVPLLPKLTDRFTCYTMSTRGRGLSADHPDHSIERLLDDVTAFIETIDPPVALIGWSSGAILALAVAARARAICGVAAYEPHTSAALTRENAPANPSEVAAAVSEGRVAEAARLFLEHSGLFNPDEVAAVLAAGALDTANMLQMQEHREYDKALDASVLARITAPVLLLHGVHTAAWFRDSVLWIADHLDAPQIVSIPDVGHMGPSLAAQPVADHLRRFLHIAHPTPSNPPRT